MNQLRTAQGRRHPKQVPHNFVSAPGSYILFEACPLFRSARPDQSIGFGSGVAASPVQRGPNNSTAKAQGGVD